MSVKKKSSNEINLTQLVTNIPIRRRLIDQDDRDKFEWDQWQSATKSINNVESPPKEKHVRNLILGTFRLEGARLFWSMVIKIHVESHPIICWKFCYVIHRILRDGHKHVIPDSILLSSYFDQLCKYWSGLQENYGQLTHRYCHLILSKLKFHERNSIFLGNLTINEQNNNNIQCLFNNNLNLYLQLCIELFDYMEELLNLVQIIFTSIDQSRSNSMTIVGQCRLNPLIICIQDSSFLYDYIVKILFKLHQGLSGETLQPHRQRLIDQFRRLKRFYGQSSTLQYFKNLIKVPILPENPPNFNIKEDLENYRTPVAIVNTPPPDSSQMIDDILIDLSDNNKSTVRPIGSDDLSANGTISNRVVNSSKEISDLEQRLIQYDTMLKQNRSETDDLHRTIAAKDAELITERTHRLQLEEQFRQQLDDQKRLEEVHTIEGVRRDLVDKNREHEENLIDLIHEKEILEQKILDLEQTTREWAQKFIDSMDKQKLMQTNHENLLNNIKRQYKLSILTYCINQMHDGIDRRTNIELLNGIEYLLSKLQEAVLSTKTVQDLWKNQNESDEAATLLFLNECITLANCMIDIVVHGKAVSNLSEDCCDVTKCCIDLYTNYQKSSNEIDKQSNELIHRLNFLIEKSKI